MGGEDKRQQTMSHPCCFWLLENLLIVEGRKLGGGHEAGVGERCSQINRAPLSIRSILPAV